jgi:hypothetical protein
MKELIVGMAGNAEDMNQELEAEWMEILNDRLADEPENYYSTVMENYGK